MKKLTAKKIKFILIGVILILVTIIIFTLSTSRDFQIEIDGLKSEISDRNKVIDSLSYYNYELKILEEVLQKDNQSLRRKKDSILKLSYEIHNPKNDFVPISNARNDSIRKWSKRFQ